jgi:hypothetical protein
MAFAVTTLAFVGMVGPARAVDSAVIAGPGAQFVNYLTVAALYQKGGTLSFVNADIASHDVRAEGAYYPVECPKSPGRCPKGTPSWCLPPHPNRPYTREFGSGNRLPFTAGKCPLFWTPLIHIGQRVKVQGVERAQPGKQYSFVCSIHPGMKGTLIVTG